MPYFSVAAQPRPVQLVQVILKLVGTAYPHVGVGPDARAARSRGADRKSVSIILRDVRAKGIHAICLSPRRRPHLKRSHGQHPKQKRSGPVYQCRGHRGASRAIARSVCHQAGSGSIATNMDIRIRTATPPRATRRNKDVRPTNETLLYQLHRQLPSVRLTANGFEVGERREDGAKVPDARVVPFVGCRMAGGRAQRLPRSGSVVTERRAPPHEQNGGKWKRAESAMMDCVVPTR